MKVLVAADMEGVSGVVHWDHVSAGKPDYARFRRVMTAEVNAAVRGAFEGGAQEVVVTDGHAAGRNLLIEELDPRVRLNCGSPAPLAMVQGAEEGIDAAIFVGYHARAGTPNAILDHTWSSARVMNVWLNDQVLGETGLNAAMCGHYGAPVVMVTGDQAVCAEARALLGDIETVVVKRARGHMAAECLAPERTQAAIHEAATRALQRLRTGQSPPPFCPATPITLRVQVTSSQLADQAAALLGARRLADKQVELLVEDMPAAYRMMRAVIAMG